MTVELAQQRAKAEAWEARCHEAWKVSDVEISSKLPERMEWAYYKVRSERLERALISAQETVRQLLEWDLLHDLPWLKMQLEEVSSTVSETLRSTSTWAPTGPRAPD